MHLLNLNFFLKIDESMLKIYFKTKIDHAAKIYYCEMNDEINASCYCKRKRQSFSHKPRVLPA